MHLWWGAPWHDAVLIDQLVPNIGLGRAHDFLRLSSEVALALAVPLAWGITLPASCLVAGAGISTIGAATLLAELLGLHLQASVPAFEHVFCDPLVQSRTSLGCIGVDALQIGGFPPEGVVINEPLAVRLILVLLIELIPCLLSVIHFRIL